MERRHVLVGLAALASTPALAQSNPPPPTDAPAPPAPKAKPSEPAPAPAMKIAAPLATSDSSATHMQQTLAVGALSLMMSRVAASKVKLGALKQFVGFEITEQETVASVLKAMSMPGTPPSGLVPPPSDTEVMANLDQKGKAMMDKLRALQPGTEFERSYVKAQIDTHKQLLEIQEAYLKSPDNPDETNVAKLAKGMIAEHLILLGDIQKQTG